MHDNVHDMLGVVARSAKAVVNDDRTEFEISAERVYATDREDLWNALTDPSRRHCPRRRPW